MGILILFIHDVPRSIQALENATTILEDQYETIEALKVEVKPLTTVKDGTSPTPEITRSGGKCEFNLTEHFVAIRGCKFLNTSPN